MIQEGKVKIKVIPTSATWLGVTYKEDTDNVKEALKKLHEEGKYPDKLWD